MQTNIFVQIMEISIWAITSTSKGRGAKRWEGDLQKCDYPIQKRADCKITQFLIPFGCWSNDSDWNFYCLHGDVGLHLIYSHIIYLLPSAAMARPHYHHPLLRSPSFHTASSLIILQQASALNLCDHTTQLSMKPLLSSSQSHNRPLGNYFVTQFFRFPNRSLHLTVLAISFPHFLF